jgi:hypothetical protein
MNFIKTCLGFFSIPEVQDKYIGFAVGMMFVVGIGCLCANPDIAKIPKFANETIGLKEIWKDAESNRHFQLSLRQPYYNSKTKEFYYIGD